MDWRKNLDNTFFKGPFSSLRTKLAAAGGQHLVPSKKGQLGLIVAEGTREPFGAH
jgi:hypothetical protein